MKKSRKAALTRAVKRRWRKAVKGGPTRLTHAPTPTEQHHNGAGIISPDTANLVLPHDLLEQDENSDSLWPGRITLVIASLAALFIAIITWFVAHMPEK